MITRVWHGWTSQENAPIYENLLCTEIFTGIAGYHGISLCRRDLGDEIEFVTIMWFDSLDAVRAFAGESYDHAVVPPKARAVLSRFDAVSAHYETWSRRHSYTDGPFPLHDPSAYSARVAAAMGVEVSVLGALLFSDPGPYGSFV